MHLVVILPHLSIPAKGWCGRDYGTDCRSGVVWGTESRERLRALHALLDPLQPEPSSTGMPNNAKLLYAVAAAPGAVEAALAAMRSSAGLRLVRRLIAPLAARQSGAARIGVVHTRAVDTFCGNAVHLLRTTGNVGSRTRKLVTAPEPVRL